MLSMCNEMKSSYQSASMGFRLRARRSVESAVAGAVRVRCGLAAEVGEPGETDMTTVPWTAHRLAAIQRAAARFGMPYQTYVKDAAFRRALRDLADVDRLGV